MTEQHPDDGSLLALALDDADPAVRESTLRHLAACHRCRNEYDALSAAVEQTLVAAPTVEPAPGFDVRVLDALGIAPDAVARARRFTPRSRRWQLVAAVAAGLVIGVGGSVVAGQVAGPDTTTVAENTSLLETNDGDPVGTVTRSTIAGEPVFVVSVHSGKVGMSYLCLLRLGDGKQIETADWVLESARGETWVVQVPEEQVTELVLVANGGAGPVWSTARL